MGRERITPHLEVDHAAAGVEGGLLDDLGEVRMRVHAAGQILGASRELHGDGRLGDQFARPGADDVHAEDPVGVLVRKDLHEAVGVSEGLGPAVGGEREAALVRGSPRA